MSTSPISIVPEPTVVGMLLTPGEVAERLKVSRSWVYSAVKKGDLKAIFIGRLPRIRESDLAAYLAARS